MIEMKYVGEDTAYKVAFAIISADVVQLAGDFPVKTLGFTLSRIGKSDKWNYTKYTTVYRQLDGAVQFSNDGSVYVEPEPPEPEPVPEPTLEELQEAKVQEMNTAQQTVIAAGVDVQLSGGETEHFTLTQYDQQSLMGLQTQVAEGAEAIPWHTSNEAEHCKFYSNADMQKIVDTALAYVTWHVTYFRDLRIYVRSLTDKESVQAVTYGIEIPVEYQSEPLKAMLAAQKS